MQCKKVVKQPRKLENFEKVLKSYGCAKVDAKVQLKTLSKLNVPRENFDRVLKSFSRAELDAKVLRNFVKVKCAAKKL